jgi:hypothetical protein
MLDLRSFDHPEVALLDGAGSSAWKQMVNLPVREMLRLRERMRTMQNTLEQLHHVTGIADWDGTLPSAEARLRAAAEAATDEAIDQMGRAAAQAEFDGWSAIIIAHPEYTERETQAAGAWEGEHLGDCEAALEQMRRLIPPQVAAMSRKEIAAVVEPPALAKRLWAKRILWFCWMQPEAIASIHFAELDSTYWPFGLDLRELRAVYCVLHAVRWVSDHDHRKAQWATRLRARLIELTEQAARLPAGAAAPRVLEHLAYAKAVLAPSGSVPNSPTARPSTSAPQQTLRLDMAGGGVRRCPFSTAGFGRPAARFAGHPLVLAEPVLADSPLANAAEVAGAAVVAQRGVCSFVEKARRVQAAGGVAAIFVNTDEELFTIGGEDGDDDITIAIVGIRASDGRALLLHGGTDVHATFDYDWEKESLDESDESDYEELSPRPGAFDKESLLEEIRAMAAARESRRRVLSPQHRAPSTEAAGAGAL